MATTITVIPIIKKLTISTIYLFSHSIYAFSTANLIHITITIKIALYNPNLPISSAIAANLTYKGVANIVIN